MANFLVDPAEVNRHWPHPTAPQPIGDSLAHTSAAKLLMGFALLARNHPTPFGVTA